MLWEVELVGGVNGWLVIVQQLYCLLTVFSEVEECEAIQVSKMFGLSCTELSPYMDMVCRGHGVD